MNGCTDTPVLWHFRARCVPNWLVLLALLTIAELWSPPSAQASASDSFPARIDAAGETLTLRGAHRFRWFAWKLYDIALYVPAGEDAGRVLDAETPRVLEIHYARDIKAADIVKATEENLRRNPDVRKEDHRADLDRLYESFRDLRKGDVYRVTHDPEAGLILELNGVESARFESAEFSAVFFGLWLSEHPLDKDMRKDLLGP